MHSTAPSNIFLTDVSTFLSQELAKYYLSQGFLVYGLGKHHIPSSLLKLHNFTLLDIDINQPIPGHLPKFDLIFDFLNPTKSNGITVNTNFPISYTNLSNHSPQARTFIVVKIETDQEVDEYLQSQLKENLSLVYVGDIYGPAMDFENTGLFSNLIEQAVKTDKIIIENEGNDIVYPTYITDAVAAVAHLVSVPAQNKPYFIVSESPITSLSASYEIQKYSTLYLNKDLGLFFKGYPQPAAPQPHLHLNTHLPQRTDLATGLKSTLSYFSAHTKPVSSASVSAMARQIQPRVVIEEKKFEKFKKIKPPEIKINTLYAKKPKLIGAVLILIVVIFFAKLAFDLYSGAVLIKQSGDLLASGNFDKASKEAETASVSFENSLGKVKIIAFPISFVLPQKTKGLKDALKSAALSAKALSKAAEASAYLTKDISVILGKSDSSLDTQTPSALLKQASLYSSQAYLLAQSAQSQNILKSKTKSLEEKSYALMQSADSAYDLLNLIPALTGSEDSRTYLLLLQNNAELRPGGGFIGSVGLVSFESGRLKSIDIQDVYALDGQLKEKIQPPVPLKDKLKVDQFYLRDSNWTPDFTINSGIARDFYKKETGKNVDGVIAFDVNFMQQILKLTGPIRLADYNEDISDSNLLERGQFHSEIGFFPGSTQKKDFFGTLAQNLMLKLVTNLSGQETGSFSYLPFLQTVENSLSQKHLMVSFDDPNLTSYIKSQNWNASLPPAGFDPSDDSTETRDFISISEANVGANKVNRYIQRKISYEMTIGRDADLVGNLKISYNNTSQADTWPAGKYTNFLRVYLPAGASLFAYQNGDSTSLKDVTIASKGSLTELALYVEVPIKSQKDVTFSYRLPKNIKLEKAPTYHLYVQKQPGTDSDPFTFKLNLPDYLSLKSQSKNLLINTNLAQDWQTTQEIVKK